MSVVGNGCLAALKLQALNIGPTLTYFRRPTGYLGINIELKHRDMIILESRALRVEIPGVAIHGMSLKEQLLLISIKRADARDEASAPDDYNGYIASKIKLGPEI